MRPVCLAAILLATIAAVTTAEADTIPLTVSGTETFSFESLPDGNYSQIAPSVTLTGTGLYDTGFGFPGISITPSVSLSGFPESTYIPLNDGAFEQGGNPEFSVTFDYVPNGLSSGTFSYESHNNSGYLDPSGNFFPGITFIDAYGTVTQTVTPEPSTFALLGTGLLGIAGTTRRRLRS